MEKEKLHRFFAGTTFYTRRHGHKSMDGSIRREQAHFLQRA